MRLTLVGTILFVLFATGCATTIVPPPAPVDSVTVFLLDHGRTPSLVLPAADNKMIRYAYGDWQWYARINTGVFQGFAALFLPTQGTLGRKLMDGPAETEVVSDRVSVGIEHIFAIQVSRQKVEQLQAELDGIFQRNLHTRIVNDPYDFEFVHHPRNYWIFHNSNHEAAHWLRQLGCQTRGLALTSEWKIKPAKVSIADQHPSSRSAD